MDIFFLKDDDDELKLHLLGGFPVERRETGHLVPIVGGRRLAELVHLVLEECPSGCRQVGMAVQHRTAH